MFKADLTRFKVHLGYCSAPVLSCVDVIWIADQKKWVKYECESG